MKKILFSLICVAFLGVAHAQSTMTPTNGLATDTVVDAGTKNVTLQVKDKQATVTMVVRLVKIDGTVAGTATPQGSLDGTTFVSLASASTLTNVASQAFTYTETDSKYTYYRWAVTGTGTMRVIVSGKLLGRK